MSAFDGVARCSGLASCREGVRPQAMCSFGVEHFGARSERLLGVTGRSSSPLTPPRTDCTWEPALRGSDGERALQWALRIGDRLRWRDASQLDGSLASGAAGLAVLFATLAAVTGERRYDEPADRYISLAADQMVADFRAAG